ncbi:MAG: uroporphyrinogen-III C-methyltransferase [Pseudohongiellaceae bacterium]
MTEQSETPKILDEIAKSNAAKPGNSASRKQQTARRRFAVVIIILLPIVAGVLFVGYQQIDQQTRLAELELENQRLNQSLAAQSSQLGQIEQARLTEPDAIEFDDSSVRQLELSLTQEISVLTAQLAELQAEQLSASNETDQQWKVLEAQYLLGIASQKLQLEGDVATAIAQLQLADRALVDSGSSSAFAVRQAIASDLQALRNIEVLDREGIYLRLDNLIAEMESIDLLNSMRTEFENRRDAGSQPLRLGADASNYLDSSLEFLGTIFVWRKWEETPQAMLAPGQDDLIKQNLRLMLEQAQLALLMRDDSLYQQAMMKSKDWFQRYAVTESIQGQTVTTELDRLSSLDIDPLLPALSQSLSLINQLVASER